MGWTCQHDYQGFCKKVQKVCIPGMKGCTLKGDFIFSDQVKKETKEEEKHKEDIDFATLARSN